MPRASPRRRLARGIYTDGASSLELTVQVRKHRITERHPADTDLAVLIERRDRLEAEAKLEIPRPASRGSLAGDTPVYLKLIRSLHPTTVRSRSAHLAAWNKRLGPRPRHRITAHDVLEARAAWLEADLSPKSVNHRVETLRHLYRTLDGKRPGPCDDVAPLPGHKTPINRVSPATILAVHRKLAEKHAVKRPGPSTKPRALARQQLHARFCVLVSTGKRPSELMRAQPGDVDLEARIWVPRDGKGGWSPGLYLNDDMLAAWTLFIKVDAWGEFSTRHYARALRRAGWPADVRPYNARHSLLIALVEAGADMADVQLHAGHKSLTTTRRAYTGILGSRQQRTSELLDGRFGGFSAGPARGTGKKRP